MTVLRGVGLCPTCSANTVAFYLSVSASHSLRMYRGHGRVVVAAAVAVAAACWHAVVVDYALQLHLRRRSRRRRRHLPSGIVGVLVV